LLDRFCELVIRSALPKGAAWTPKPGGNYDIILTTIGDILKLICQRMENARFVRDPKNTFVFDDLEREFGILKNSLITEAQRRIQLNAKKNQPPGGGTASDLQKALDDAGFDLLVHKNNPSVDPAIFLDQLFQMVANGDKAFAGNDDAFAGKVGGELLVNGDLFLEIPAITMQAGGSFAFAGNSDAIAGRFDSILLIPVLFEIPTDPDTFGFVFFVGGEATRDPITDELTEIEQGFVTQERKEELKRIILTIKPNFTWAGLIITFT